ncbi:MAG: helix-turn-helix domain-containing protein [Clostridia bacterium]|nr:helix-turn-helix domain-containing protein [Clostridia bacterium]
MTSGERIGACRRAGGWTQEQLAEMLGVSRQSVSRWEMDSAFPETEKLIRLSKLFGCSVDYLLNITDDRLGQQDRMAAGEAFRFIRSCGYFFLATCRGEKPSLRPMGMIALQGGDLILATDRRKQVYREMTDNAYVELAAYHLEERKWVRVAGRVMPDISPEALAEMEALYPMISQEYAGDMRQALALFRILADSISLK